ncbi:hypothetical protein QA597_07710 [Marinilabiliaceae bacterium ANBcel2]|nr:hypothetical protein [Marinilabiliaceae bacterium ANBcel2]
MNDFFVQEGISPDDIIEMEYSAHSSGGINTYSSLIMYKKS